MKTARQQRASRPAPSSELAEVRARLAEVEETLRAIRSGEVDAVVVAGKQGPRVFTLEGAEHAYRVLIESMNEGALTLTVDQMILYANQRFGKMVKCPLEQVIGSSFRRFLSAEDVATLGPLLKRAAESGTKIQVILHAADGSKMPAHISIRRLARNGSKSASVGMVVTDMTEAVMRASEMRYRRLFEAARDGILILDPDTRKITEANPFMTELLGYPRKELLGKELWEIGLLNDEPASQAAFRQLQKEHFIRYEDLPLQNKKGELREVEFVSNLYRENGHEVIQCNIRDITERRRAERALLDAKNEIARHALELEKVVAERTVELRETIGELEGFSYSVSHDMRAPLRAMQSFAQFLVDDYGGKLDDTGVNYLHQIMRSAVRLDQLIQDVLSYTRILHAELPMDRVDLDRLVRDIAEIFPNGRPNQPKIQIEGTLPYVMGNEALLAQCVSNLLSNGAKFIAPGTTPHLEVSAEAMADDSIRVRFKDNGIGIALENHERIFRLFERIHPATVYEGTGIGLTIVRKATERMGAQVGFESEPGKGSNFWIQLKKG